MSLICPGEACLLLCLLFPPVGFEHRSLLIRKASNAVAVCLVLSKLGYCSSLVAGLPQAQIETLQAVQNAASRVMLRQRRRDHITTTLRELHWLPVRGRILHKLLSATYRSVHCLWAHSAIPSVSFCPIGERFVFRCSWAQGL